jgi:hypothetical protein
LKILFTPDEYSVFSNLKTIGVHWFAALAHCIVSLEPEFLIDESEPEKDLNIPDVSINI